jgi:hypothetical protein
LKIKITHLKTVTNPILSLKIGQAMLILNHTQNLQRTLQSTLTNGSIAYKLEEQTISQMEAERKRNEARTYASITPIR